MKKLKNYAAATVGFVLFAAVVVFTIPQTGHGKLAGDKDVVVVNSPRQPVPVAVQGTSSVNIANSPTVQLDNSAAKPIFTRDIDRPTAQPFQKSVDITLDAGENSKGVSIPVPNGRILVIEQISGFGTGVPGETVDFSILTNVPSQQGYEFHYLLTTRTEDVPGNISYRFNEQVRIYSNDVPFPIMRADRSSANSSVNFKITVSGYLTNK